MGQPNHIQSVKNIKSKAIDLMPVWKIPKNQNMFSFQSTQ